MGTTKKYAEDSMADIKYAIGDVDIVGNMFHNHHELYLLLHGEVELICSRTRTFLEPGQIVIIPSGEYHQFVVHSDVATYERCVINISPMFISNDDKSVFSTVRLLSLSPENRILSNFHYLMNAISQYSKNDFMRTLLAVITDILILVKNTLRDDSLYTEKMNSAPLSIMRYIDAHYTEHLTLDKIADACFLSVSSVSHIFKDEFGISVKKYIMQKRMSGAYLALLSGMSSSEVCIAYGFSDYSAFYRAYKKQFGFSPTSLKNHNCNSIL